MNKIINPGKIDGHNVFCKITIKDGRLSITGVVGPYPNGNSAGSCGQIIDELDKIDSYNTGWSRYLVAVFKSIWKSWHLNDMRAGCVHQRNSGWDKVPIDPDKPLDSYGKFFPGQKSNSWNMLAWITPKERPDGLLTVACPTCGYKYGTEWLKEELPVSVINHLESLPDSTITPKCREERLKCLICIM
jgi:rubredoxin